MSEVLVDDAFLRAHPLPPVEDDADKEARGSVLIVGGGVQTPGAVLLPGLAALRAGAGKLAVATVRSCAVPLAVAMPEARVVGLDERDGEIAPDAAPQASPLAKTFSRCAAAVVGPGMLDKGSACRLALDLIGGDGEAGLVLDAAAMTGLLNHAAAVRAAAGRLVLTPHAGEMASLLGVEIEAVKADPAACARKAAQALGAVVVMKGATTFIVPPEGAVWRHEGGSAGLGSSGSGDVLAGLLGGLLARGAEPMTAAAWAVRLHAKAGEVLAAQVGPVGYLARQIGGEVPALMAALS
jgi:ADP-dependent NAD(P)H-hydrate dehydratase